MKFYFKHINNKQRTVSVEHKSCVTGGCTDSDINFGELYAGVL